MGSESDVATDLKTDFINGNNFILHSALIRNLIKLKGTVKLTAQGERVCLKDSKYILFEILAHRT